MSEKVNILNKIFIIILLFMLMLTFSGCKEKTKKTGDEELKEKTNKAQEQTELLLEEESKIVE